MYKVRFGGLMGVPLTFTDKYDPDQFEMMYCSAYSDPTHNGIETLYVDGKRTYTRLIVRRKACTE